MSVGFAESSSLRLHLPEGDCVERSLAQSAEASKESDGCTAVTIDLSLVRFSTGLAKAVVESTMAILRGTITDWV